MVWAIHHLTEPVTILHIQPILMVRMALAEGLAVAEDLAVDEDLAVAEGLAEEDGGKLYDKTLRAVLEHLTSLLSSGLKGI
jgi:hypothetical protein